MKTYHFPKNFLWGTATAAHQIEGNNTNSDWWRWEQAKDYSKPEPIYPREPSGIACDSYNRYEEDFDLCVQMHNNAVRFSVEWARLEPKEGVFDEKEFDHYKKVIQAAKKRGLKTFVTLHHFTNPIWLADKEDWLNRKTPEYFARYAKKCAEEFGDSIDAYITLNEPHGYALMTYLGRRWLYPRINVYYAFRCMMNLVRGHNRAYDAIKSVNKNYVVGVVNQPMWTIGVGNFLDKIIASIGNRFFIDLFQWPIRKHLDFVGVNFYLTIYLRNFRLWYPDERRSDFGWWVGELGLEKALLKMSKYKVPLYVTENGIADSKDRLREAFIKNMLHSCANAIDQGVDLRGYFYWSLIDNFEWAEGFRMKFGLVEIDREHNLARKPRKSASYYAKISKENGIEF